MPAAIQASAADLQRAVQDLDLALARAPDDALKQAVAKLSLRCRPQNSGGQAETTMRAALLLADLAEHPGWAVLEVLEAWPKLSPFMPVIADLLPMIQRRTRPYLAMRSALARAAAAVDG